MLQKKSKEVMDTQKLEKQEKDEKKEKLTGTLYLVSTPIGNDDDITLRALKVMNKCDAVICEEAKVGARTLHKYNITKKMELLNEQNENEMTPEMLKWLMDGKNLALISDCGTPVFADPGYKLVQSCINKEIDMVVVPGASSIMAAVVRSGFSLTQFLYAGFLDRDKEVRLQQLKNIQHEPRTVVLLETPYRLMPLLEACKKVMPKRRAYLGCNLTMRYETHHYGTFEELYAKFWEKRFKGEFVIVFQGHFGKKDESWKPRRDFAKSRSGDRRFSDRGRSGDRRFNDRRSGDRRYGDRDRKYGDRDRRSDGGKRYDRPKKKQSYDSRTDMRSYDSSKDEGGFSPRGKSKYSGRRRG